MSQPDYADAVGRSIGGILSGIVLIPWIVAVSTLAFSLFGRSMNYHPFTLFFAVSICVSLLSNNSSFTNFAQTYKEHIGFGSVFGVISLLTISSLYNLSNEPLTDLAVGISITIGIISGVYIRSATS